MGARRQKSTIRGGVHESLPHDSAAKHIRGDAVFVDDIPEPPGTVHVAVGLSEIAHGRVKSMDLSAVRRAPGVVTVLTAADVPGKNDVAPVHEGDPLFVGEVVMFKGQALFGVAAETMDQARRAARLARVVYEEYEPTLTVDEALARESFVLPSKQMTRGDPKAAIADAPHRLTGRIEVGGQEHFYLEGQVSLVVPMEDGDMLVYCSSQHPTEIQRAVAHVLGRAANAVTVEVRRMGGAFGGKESQAAQFAATAAVFAGHLKRPVKMRLDRDDDMVLTGKRHDFVIEYDVGFDGQGRIAGIEFMQASRCGHSADLSGAISDRAMFHADNAYYLPHVGITSHRCRTHTVSNTAFRGFGGPQGMLGIEHVIDEIARHLGMDGLEVRRANLYGKRTRNVTPYGMTVEDNILGEMIADLENWSDYRERRRRVETFNATSPILKKGLALTPVKFGISFTTTFINQAGALVHVYTDGSVHLNHGGTEMGQGLFVKVAQVVAEEFQIDIDRIKVTATNTGKVPNTSPTAASSGADMNAAAASLAASTIKKRLLRFAAERYGADAGRIVFRGNHVHVGRRRIPFAELVQAAYMARVPLSATGFYRTPKIGYDRDNAQGRPFYYFAYGAAVSEVVVDTLTGEYKALGVDILHDCGRSLNPAIDQGQVEGGFVQGMGWLTTEELWWAPNGGLATHSPSTYKIPVASDLPREFRVRLLETGRNREDIVHRSKAVGEPPLMLAISVFLAIKDAVAAIGEGRLSPSLDAPATPERVLTSIGELRRRLSLGEQEAAE